MCPDEEWTTRSGDKQVSIETKRLLRVNTNAPFPFFFGHVEVKTNQNRGAKGPEQSVQSHLKHLALHGFLTQNQLELQIENFFRAEVLTHLLQKAKVKVNALPLRSTVVQGSGSLSCVTLTHLKLRVHKDKL